MFHSITEAVAYYGKKYPEKLCVADQTQALTYQEICKKIVLLREKIKALELKSEDKLAVECSQDANYLIAALACQLSGVIFVPVEKNASRERVEDIVTAICPKYLVCSQKEEWKADLHTKILLTEEFYKDETGEGEVETSSYEVPEKEAVAEILYSTGTTGKAKGIVITNGNNVAIAENIIEGTCMKENSTELVPMPLSHSHALRTCYANLLHGSSVVIIDGVMKVKQVFELMDKYQVTALDLSPSGANVLVKLAKKRLAQYSKQIDFIEIGSAVLEEGLKEQLCVLFPESRLYNFYGSTEAGRSCILDFNKEKDKPGCIGKPTKNATFLITDQNRQVIESSKDAPGLLAIAGAMNMKEYYGEKELTEKTVVNGFIYTSDLGYIDKDGYVYVLGRMDDVINYNGIKIPPEEIESCVVKYPGVKDCACVPMKDPLSGQVPKVFVSVQNKETFDSAELLKYLSDFLDANKMPKKVEVIDEIPRTSNGKLLRRKLREDV